MASEKLPWTKDPEVMGGVPVFRGTRVPLSALFETLRRGGSLETFHDDFPSVPIEVAQRALEFAEEFSTAA